jgi:hypothetical protein
MILLCQVCSVIWPPLLESTNAFTPPYSQNFPCDSLAAIAAVPALSSRFPSLSPACSASSSAPHCLSSPPISSASLGSLPRHLRARTQFRVYCNNIYGLPPVIRMSWGREALLGLVYGHPLQHMRPLHAGSPHDVLAASSHAHCSNETGDSKLPRNPCAVVLDLLRDCSITRNSSLGS